MCLLHVCARVPVRLRVCWGLLGHAILCINVAMRTCEGVCVCSDVPGVSGAYVGTAVVGVPVVGTAVVGAAVGAHVPPGTSANTSNSKPPEPELPSEVNMIVRLVELVLNGGGMATPL